MSGCASTLLMLLLIAANAHKCLWVLGAVDEDKVMSKIKQVEMDQYVQMINIKALIGQILQTSDKTAKRLEKMEDLLNQSKVQIEEMNERTSNISGMFEEKPCREKNVDFAKTEQGEQTEAVTTSQPACLNSSQWMDFNRTNLFSADGRRFYFNKTKVRELKWISFPLTHAHFKVPWLEARDYCLARGMQLASLKTLSQVEAVAKGLRDANFYHHAFWLSGSDIDRTPGQFHWLDGTVVENSSWNYHPQQIEPNQFGIGKKACIELGTLHAKLFDYNCFNIAMPLCELPAALSACF